MYIYIYTFISRYAPLKTTITIGKPTVNEDVSPKKNYEELGGSSPFISHKVRPFGRGPTTRPLGDETDHHGIFAPWKWWKTYWKTNVASGMGMSWNLGSTVIGSMGYNNRLINGVYWGYNPLTNLLLTSWNIQVGLGKFDRLINGVVIGLK